MSIPYYLESLINSVPPNSSARFNCPVCRGENTLGITKEHGAIHWHCFKASCSVKGKGRYLASLNDMRFQLRGSTEAKEALSIPDYLVYGVSSEKCAKMIEDNHCLEPYQKGLFNVAYDPAQDRVCFYIKKGKDIVGLVGKACSKGVKPKTINYKGSDKNIPFIVGKTDTVVLVEDCLSAASVARIPELTGLALLGTNLKDEYIPVILKYTTIIVALDKDAFKKALAIKNKLCYYHSQVKLWRLEKDIKELSDEELFVSYEKELK